MVRLCFSPTVIMEMQLVFLLRVHRYLYCLFRETGRRANVLFNKGHIDVFWLKRAETVLNSHLVETGKRIVFAFFCHSSPVVEYSPIPSSRITEGHPLPGTDLFTAQFGFDCPVALGGVTGKKWRRIPGDCEKTNRICF